VVTDEFLDNKRDRERIRKSAFLGRVAASASRVQKRRSSLAANKKRRPSKKLVASLESLGDVLGEIEAEDDDMDGNEDASARASGKIRHKSLKSRPGALKRKEKVVRGEMDRFGKNMAQLHSIPAGEEQGMAVTNIVEVDTSSATANRWKALRGFITATMEQNPAFASKT
jgi:hypothetical protein